MFALFKAINFNLNNEAKLFKIIEDAYHRFQEFYSGVLRFIKHHEVKLDNISFDELETDVFFFVHKREQNY